MAEFAGSSNDVIWEVFAGGTSTELGESKFHLSCSDSEMDGPEDRGSRQGNGKSNESSLINDWLFEGMIDSDENLDCTPKGGRGRAVDPPWRARLARRLASRRLLTFS